MALCASGGSGAFNPSMTLCAFGTTLYSSVALYVFEGSRALNPSRLVLNWTEIPRVDLVPQMDS